MHLINRILIVIILLLITSCEELFDYSPYVIDFNDKNSNVNQSNINTLISKTEDDTIKFAVTGDSHMAYDETNGFVEKANEDKSLDFVIHTGDLTDFGLPKQYIWGNSALQMLNKPYFVTIGNHDLAGNGKTSYLEMFGPLDFSFIYCRMKLIFINTNSREFKFNGHVPDLDWLDAQLKPENSFNKVIVIYHVPPDDDDFDSLLKNKFYETLVRYNNVLLSVHGHTHNFKIYQSRQDQAISVNTYALEDRKFNVITIINKDFYIETIDF